MAGRSNHDVIDGMGTYNRYILQRDWLGGWLLPQVRVQCAVCLTSGWRLSCVGEELWVRMGMVKGEKNQEEEKMKRNRWVEWVCMLRTGVTLR